MNPSDVITGVHLVDPVVHGDERGFFVETYRREWFPQGREMIQGNRGDRQAGAVVGLHYHLHQADYWYVPYGTARVVLHDLRVGSPTDGATQWIDLGRQPDGTHSHRGVFIPPGVAHGFAALTGVRPAAEPVHRDRQGLVGFGGDRAVAHRSGGEPLDDLAGGLDLVEGNRGPDAVAELQQPA